MGKFSSLLSLKILHGKNPLQTSILPTSLTSKSICEKNKTVLKIMLGTSKTYAHRFALVLN